MLNLFRKRPFKGRAKIKTPIKSMAERKEAEKSD
jgi:hypothetical protein